MTKHLQEHMMVLLVQEQVLVLEQVLVQQVLVQQGLGQQVLVKSMVLLNIHQIHLSSSIRKPGTLT
jgi:hypothetical protein